MKSLISIAVITVSLALAGGATAQQLSPNPKAPIDITADELEVVNARCEAIWRGSAEAVQDTAHLRADVLKIFNKPGPPKASAAKPGAAANPACGDMDRMEAEGSVYYWSPQQRVHGAAAVYQADTTTIVFTGDVVAVRGQNVMRGDKMVFNTQTGEGQMQGGAKGHGGKSRPRGVFYPSQSTTPAEGGDAAQKPAKAPK